uniref:8.9 kDa family member n=1 Tax=Rhipicephalus appendiculatus TaxID=34631 RepID=A0A131YPP3_RHIAP
MNDTLLVTAIALVLTGLATAALKKDVTFTETECIYKGHRMTRNTMLTFSTSCSVAFCHPKEKEVVTYGCPVPDPKYYEQAGDHNPDKWPDCCDVD